MKPSFLSQMTFFDHTQPYLFESAIEYDCGPARAFNNSALGIHVPTLKLECQWDGQWSPGTKLDECICKLQFVDMIFPLNMIIIFFWLL